MKKIYVCIILCTSLFLSSCNDLEKPLLPEGEISQAESNLATIELSDEIVVIDGVKAYVPKGMTKSAFNLNPGQFLDFVNSSTLSNARGTFEFNYDNLGSQDIIDIIIHKLNLIPDLSDLNKLEEGEILWKKISKVFPEIKNAEEARSEKNYNAIAMYYSDLLRFYIIPDLIKKAKSSKKARPNVVTISPLEASFAASQPLAASRLNIAATDANSLTNAAFSNPNASDIQDGKENAFRHAVWNAMGVQEMLQVGFSREGAVDRTRELTSSREWTVTACINCPDPANYSDNASYASAFIIGSYYLSSTQTTGDANAMDLFNNLSGRTYTRNNTGWGLFGIRKYPTDTQIRNHFWSIIYNNQCLLKPTANDIFQINSSVYNWVSLGSLASNGLGVYDPNENILVRIVN